MQTYIVSVLHSIQIIHFHLISHQLSTFYIYVYMSFILLSVERLLTILFSNSLILVVDACFPLKEVFELSVRRELFADFSGKFRRPQIFLHVASTFTQDSLS